MRSITNLLIITLISLLDSCEKEKIYFEDKGNIFSTTYTIKYKYNRPLEKEIEQKLLDFDNSLNPFKESSIISKVNKNEDVVLDSLFVNVFVRSQEISHLSDGLFDITVSPLINAWSFGFKNMDNINQHTLDSLRRFVGHKKIRLEGNKIIKNDPRININTSAIAKAILPTLSPIC